MTIDLTAFLNEWPYEAGQINVRLIQGDDGDPKIQMRLDLGVLQMDVAGRPDGQRPHGMESLLEHHEALIDEAAEPEPAGDPDADPDAPDPDEPGARTLTEDECRLLREEAVQYYHRYISLLVLGDFDGVVRDTSRNLRVLDLCRDHAEGEEDRDLLEQFRPYITMMRTRALATQLVTASEPKAALFVIDEGLESLQHIYEASGRSAEFEKAGEVQLLRGMRDELTLKLPASQKSELQDRLRRAIADENYELAAILRDEIRMLKESGATAIEALPPPPRATPASPQADRAEPGAPPPDAEPPPPAR